MDRSAQVAANGLGSIDRVFTDPEVDTSRVGVAGGSTGGLLDTVATFGFDAHLGYWVFSTNGVATAGLAGIPTVGFGPGHEKHAHAPNEHVEIEHLVRAAAFYMSFATEFVKG